MKNLKVMMMALMMCLSLNSFCQSDTLITDNAEKWFKSFYVNVNFKDPNSYKLIKIQSRPVTLRDSLNRVLNLENNSIQSDSLNIKENTIIYYSIYIECYGTNSFDKLVFCQYSFHFKPNEFKGFNMIRKDNGVVWSEKTKTSGTKAKTPGGLIISSQNDWFIGTALTTAGGLIMLAPSLLKSSNAKPATIIGLVFCGIGAGFYISSHIKMKKAGILLNENGIGFKINL